MAEKDPEIVSPGARVERRCTPMTDQQRPPWAVRLQAEREARGWSKHEMARRLLRAAGHSQQAIKDLARQILDWEKGRHFPRDWASHYAAAFDIDEVQLFYPRDRADMDDHRRHLLACLGLLGVDAAVRPEPLEPIRQALAQVTPGRPQSSAVQDWEEVAFEHGHAFLTTPPEKLLPDLAADIVTLQNSIRTANSDTAKKGLCGPAGKLAALVAMTVATLGEPRQARDWWKTARHTADASPDRDLKVWVRGYEAMNALYSGRPLPLVLKRADEAVAIAGDTCGAAVMEALASRAQALALLGRAQDAEETIQTMQERFGGLPAATADDRLSTSAWPETALRHTAAFTYTHTGNAVCADRAQTAALALYPASMHRQRAQIELLRATCRVQQGDISTGVQHATTTVQELSHDQRTTTIQRGAHMVLAAIPETQRNHHAVQEYRQILTPPTATG